MRRSDKLMPTGGRMAVLIAAALVGLIVLVAFVKITDGEFLNWDDDRNFLQNEAFRGLGFDEIGWACRTYHLGVWQPLAWMLFGLQFAIGGLTPKTYHAFSIFLHAANAVLFFWMALTFIRIMMSSGETRVPSRTQIFSAAAAAILFAVHPLRVEAVAWISCQPYLPAAFFAMLALTLYLRGHTQACATPCASVTPRDDRFSGSRTLQIGDGAAGMAATPRWRVLGATFLCYLVAVAFKAPAVTLPLVLLLVDVFPLRRVHLFRGFSFRAWAVAIGEKLPFFLVALCIAVLAMRAKDFNESRMPFSAWSADERLAQSGFGVVFHVWKSIWPAGLAAYYELPPNLSLAAWPFNAMAGAVVIVTFVAILFVRRAPGVLVAWMSYLVILAPNLGIVQFSQQIAADRYAYIATMPLFVLLAFAICRLAQDSAEMPSARNTTAKRYGIMVVIFIAIGALGAATQSTIRDWHDSVSLWRASVAANPRCEHSHCLLGQALAAEAQGKPDEAMQRMLADAVSHLKESVRLKPDFAFAHMNLGATLLASGRPEEARASYEKALSFSATFKPDELARLQAGLSLACAFSGDIDEALGHAREAERLGLPSDQLKRLMNALSNIESAH